MHAIEPLADATVLFDSALVRVLTVRRGQAPALCPSKPYCFAFHRTAIGIQPADGPPFVGNPNFVTFHNPSRASHRFDIDPRGGCSDWFCVNPSLVPERLELPGRWSRAPIDAGTYLLQRHVVASLECGHVRSTVDASVVQLLERVVHQVGQHAAATHGAHLTESARRAVHAAEVVVCRRLGESCSLAALAGHVGMSPFHFCRVFRRATGYAFNNYRRSLRLRSSLELIASPAKLTDIAVLLGFASHSHFTEAFHNAFGRAPSAMR